MDDKRLMLAEQKRDELLKKIEKVRGTPRESEFQMQIDKLNALIEHLTM